MSDEDGAAAPPSLKAADEPPPPPKTMPPMSTEISDASATGTSSTYTDYGLIPFDDDDGELSATPLQVENFPTKLHRILSRPDLAHAVSWLPHGRAWKVLNQEVFASVVIPEFYKHNKYSSFSRQVNGWGFRRIGSGPDHTAYYHELFLRGAPHLVKRMRRPGPVPDDKDEKKKKKKMGEKKSKIGRRRRNAAERGDGPDFYAMDHVRPLPLANPPGFVYTAEQGAQNAAASGGKDAAAAMFAAASKSYKKVMTSKKSQQKRDDVVKDGDDEAMTDGGDELLSTTAMFASSAALARKTKTKKARKKRASSSSRVDGAASSADALVSEIDSVGSSVVGGADNSGVGLAALLDQQRRLMEAQKTVLAQMQRQALNSQSAGAGAGGNPQDQMEQMNPVPAGLAQMSYHRTMGTGLQVGSQLMPASGQASAGTMQQRQQHLAGQMRTNGTGQAMIHGEGGFDPFAPVDQSTLLEEDDEDDFDAQLNELAGFLGPVDGTTTAVTADHPIPDLGAWNRGGGAVAAAADFNLPPEAAPTPIAAPPAHSRAVRSGLGANAPPQQLSHHQRRMMMAAMAQRIAGFDPSKMPGKGA